MSSNFSGINYPLYSMPNKQFNPVLPYNSQSFVYESSQGTFKTTRLKQSDVLEIIKTDPSDIGHLASPYDVSLSKTLQNVWQAIGKVDCKSGQLGTCTLISPNLAIMPSHCIEDMNIYELTATFGFVNDNATTYSGTSYKIQCVVEHDPDLDYAIIQIQDAPGFKWGYLPICSDALAYAAPALLHYPLNGPLKVSIHSFVQDNYKRELLLTYHDSDFGSSGGAYISPSQTFVAMHLGYEQDSKDFNLLRYALPIKTIIQKNPHSILSQFASKRIKQELVYDDSFFNPVSYLKPHVRNFIDIEKYFPSNFRKEDSSYVLRQPVKNLGGTLIKPGVIIDGHQAKHSSWPGSGYPGSRGKHFNLELNDVIELAEVLITALPKTFDEPYPAITQPNFIKWQLDKQVFDAAGARELYKKIKNNIEAIVITAAFSSEYWEMHFFPDR